MPSSGLLRTIAVLGLALCVLCQDWTTVCVLENNLAFSTVIGNTVIRNARLQVGDSGITLQSVTISGSQASNFGLTSAFQPIALTPNNVTLIPIKFSPSAVGVWRARLDLQLVSGSASKTFSVELRGVAAKAYGGTDEPSLQWILDAFDLPINVEDDDPSNSLIRNDPIEQNGIYYGDEIRGQLFQAADASAPVTVELLAVFGVTSVNPDTKFGYYMQGSSATPNELFVVPNVPETNGQTILPTIQGKTSFQVQAGATFGFYTQWPFFGNRLVFTEDKLNTWDAPYLHHVRVYALPNQLNSYLLAFEEYTAVKDYNDVVIIVRNVKIPVKTQYSNMAAPILSGNTPQPGFSHNWMVFSRIDQASPDHKFHDSNTLRIKNLDSAPVTIQSLNIKNTSIFSFPNGEDHSLPITIAPGSQYDLIIKFIATGGDKGIRKTSLVVETSDPNNSPIIVSLNGLYQLIPEDVNELPAYVFLQAFGFNISLPQHLSEKENSPYRGDEVRSALWTMADPSQPMFVIQTAAFHHCCMDTGFIQFPGYPLMMHATPWGQSVFPMYMQDPSRYTTETIRPAGNFPIISGGYSTANNSVLGIVMLPIRDQKGKFLPNTWYVLQDYILAGCGFATGDGNCDYNDDQYIITNLKPVTGAQQFGTLVPSTQVLDFNTNVPGTLVDKDGETTGFTHVMPNDLDQSVGSNSYSPQQIDINYSTGVISLSAIPGTFWAGNTGNTLVNGLMFNANGAQAYTLTASLVGPLSSLTTDTRQTGVLIGSDKNNNIKLDVNANNGNPVIEFVLKTQGVISTIGTAPLQNANSINSLQLRIDSDPIGQIMTASYNLNKGNWQLINKYAVLTNVSGWFFSFPESVGIYASGSGFVAQYDSFAVEYTDAALVRKCSDAYVAPEPVVTIQSPSPSVETSPSPSPEASISAVSPSSSSMPSPTSSLPSISPSSPSASSFPSPSAPVISASPSFGPTLSPTVPRDTGTITEPDISGTVSTWLGISLTLALSVMIAYILSL